jgi:hypothetical protein
VEYEAGKHVRESMQLVENAVLERDQVYNVIQYNDLGGQGARSLLMCIFIHSTVSELHTYLE